MRVVPGAGFGERDAAAIHKKMGGKMSGRLRFEIELCESIPLTQGGKSIYVDQRITGATEGLSLAMVG